MKYSSTRDFSKEYSASEAVARGLAPDGGLFVPRELPRITPLELAALAEKSYPMRAAYVMSLFLDEFAIEELEDYCCKAYSVEHFPGGAAPVVKRGDDLYLELWHGPTCAFKDMALQMLPQLLPASMKKSGQREKALILTATSGDTGKAALEGFCDVEDTEIIVFYPENGVSDVQKLQMATQRGSNVHVQAVRGNFDDAQNGVKRILGDPAIAAAAEARGRRFTSANSINWGRLLPQIAYYLSAYLDCVQLGKIAFGDELNFCVPTGNFGNILAAYYAKCIGVPIGRLICASNANNVLTDFIHTGKYDRKRDFHTTISPSMDILISSNLERLLCHLSGAPVKVNNFMQNLISKGEYLVDDSLKERISELLWADFCNDADTKQTIARAWKESHYLLDPHTAVAAAVKQNYFASTADSRKTVIVSTANPYKFCGAVISAIEGKDVDGGVELIDRLSVLAGTTPPPQLASLKDAKVRFEGSCSPENMSQIVLDFLK